MEDQVQEQQPARRVSRTWVGAAVAGAILLAGIGIAAAQTGSTSTTTPSNQAPAPGAEGFRRFGGPGGPDGPGGPGRHGGFGHGGPKGAIHGELVVPNGSGGYQTVLVQTGKVTSVSSSSITVKSEDDYSKTYAVSDNTLVNAGRDGIGDVKEGDTVRLDAVVGGSTANARDILDLTTLRAIRQHWNPEAPAAPDNAST